LRTQHIHAADHQNTVGEVSLLVLRLSTLTGDYQLNPTQRAFNQWRETHRRLGEVMGHLYQKLDGKLLPLLDELGIRVLCTLAGDARFHEVQTMHRAEATMLVCSKAMINVARMLEEKYEIPWFEGSFYGIRATSQALRDLARLIGDPDLMERTEKLIQREEKATREMLTPYIDQLKEKRAVLYTGGVKSWSVVSALQDLGMTVVATGTKKSTQQDKQRIRELMGEEAIMIEGGSPETLLGVAEEQNADLLIAGGRNMYTALKGRLPFLDINQEREFAYAGYAGMETLAQQLINTIHSPIWPLIHQAAPWQSESDQTATQTPNPQ
ncbi:MAG: hypothetical protein HQL53_13845, partial [Magnetococcales bacterium]|nr:hypothetical protein [Magnetococcales bacterium]